MTQVTAVPQRTLNILRSLREQREQVDTQLDNAALREFARSIGRRLRERAEAGLPIQSYPKTEPELRELYRSLGQEHLFDAFIEWRKEYWRHKDLLREEHAREQERRREARSRSGRRRKIRA